VHPRDPSLDIGKYNSVFVPFIAENPESSEQGAVIPQKIAPESSENIIVISRNTAKHVFTVEYGENGITMMRTDARMRGGLPQEWHQNTDYEISIGSEFAISPYNLDDKRQQSTDQ
jgi:hypothetical protein